MDKHIFGSLAYANKYPSPPITMGLKYFWSLILKFLSFCYNQTEVELFLRRYLKWALNLICRPRTFAVYRLEAFCIQIQSFWLRISIYKTDILENTKFEIQFQKVLDPILGLPNLFENVKNGLVFPPLSLRQITETLALAFP